MEDQGPLQNGLPEIKKYTFSGFLPYFAGSAFLIASALAAAEWGRGLWPEFRIGLGFALFFVLPGLFFSLLFFPHKRFWVLERLPLSIALSMGVWAFPGLLAFRMEWSLRATILIEILITLILFATVLARHLFVITRFDPDPRWFTSKLEPYLVGLVVLGLSLLCLWTGAFRGAGLDWDYFNYISAVNKLIAWGKASIAHFAYIDAPPDPIHSYNIWSLQWALIARLFDLNPIELYARSGFITIPAAALSFYALGRRIFGPGIARTALLVYVGYHVFYGGLIFLGRTTFYPADSQWLICFPACLTLFLYMFENRWDGILIGLALSVLAMSTVHVLWGLCFYLVLFAFMLSLLLLRRGAFRAIGMAMLDRKAVQVIAALGWFLAPVIAALVATAVMASKQSIDGYAPLLGGGLDFSPWFYALAFVVFPLLYLGYLIGPYRPRPGPEAETELKFMSWQTVYVIAICLAIAIPYIWLRREAVEVTDWAQFGRNPYRAHLTSSLFFLNPFQLSLKNPNMTFYPLYILGYLCLPALLYTARKKYGHRLILAALLIVPLICFNPCLATLFAEYFSLGYLRRLLRLATMFSFFPLAMVAHQVINALFDDRSRPLANFPATLLLALVLSALCVPFQARPSYYNDMFKKMVTVARTWPKNSLIHDDTPFRVAREKGFFKRDDVIFSDIWTSYRLTAYLPQFVAVQAKPGTGVEDQDERRMLEREFFGSKTTVARMRQILDRFHASGVILNRSPGYRLYHIPCGFPEAVGKLKQDPAHFELLYDKGPWVIFRYRPG